MSNNPRAMEDFVGGRAVMSTWWALASLAHVHALVVIRPYERERLAHERTVKTANSTLLIDEGMH